MEIEFKNINKSKKNNFINSKQISHRIDFIFFLEKKYYINKTSITHKNTKNIISINKNIQKGRRNIKFIKKEFILYKIIILLLIINIFKLNFQRIIVAKDSIITLKVSGNGEQKILNSDTSPDEIWIDNAKQNNEINIFNLNPRNIIKLIWINGIDDGYKMFKDCITIIEMNFTDFDATKCSQFTRMFVGCKSLISLDLSGLITSNYLKNLANMFENCHSLISLNLSTFDTSEVTNLGHMFYNCNALTWIDISNFNTEKVQYLDNMFIGCKNLISLNLSNFNTSNVIKMDNMFDGCESLKIIDFSNLDVTNVTNIESVDNIFLNCKNLEYINVKNLESNIALASNYFKGTSENLMICISDNKIQLISNVINKKNCTLVGCDNNFPEHKNSYKINTENGCLTQNCSIIYYKYEFENKCFEKCPANSMERNNSKELEEFGLDYKYFCKPICTKENPFEIINTQKCVKECNLTMIKNKMCILNYESKNNVDSLLKNIEDIFTSNDYNTLEIENGIDDIIEYNDVIVTLTTTENQKNNENNSNVTTINLGN